MIKRTTVLIIFAVACAAAGCGGGDFRPSSEGSSVPVPEPIDLLLPHRVRIHPFSGRVFTENGSQGLDVRVVAHDAYDDAVKAFGSWRFELYRYRPHSDDTRGRRVHVWQERLMDPDTNILHWDPITRAYRFKLRWFEPIAPGQKFVLVAVFSSPYTPRLFAEHVFTSQR